MAATLPRPQGTRSGGVGPNLKAAKGASLIARPSTPSRLSTAGSPGGLLSSSKTLQRSISVSQLSQLPNGQRNSLSPPNPLMPSRRLSSLGKAMPATSQLKDITDADGRRLIRKSASTLSMDDSGLPSILPSPPPSRSGSAEGSYTSMTAINGSHTEGMPMAKGDLGGGKEGKGNVVVSVRCRPDVGGNGDDLWHVDNRNSHVVYKGGEGGDYIYGLF